MKNSLGSDKDKQACVSKSISRWWEQRVTSSVSVLFPSPRPSGTCSTAGTGICQRSSFWILHIKRFWGSVQPRKKIFLKCDHRRVSSPSFFQGQAHELCYFIWDLGQFLSRLPSGLCTRSHHHHRIRWPSENLAHLEMHYQVITALPVHVTPVVRSKRFSFFRFSSNC